MNGPFTELRAVCAMLRSNTGASRSTEETMERRHRLPKIVAGGAATLLLSTLAMAPSSALAAGGEPAVTEDESRRISETLTRQGYSNIHDIELDDGRFEVDATNSEGHEVDVELDTETLEILHEDRD